MRAAQGKLFVLDGCGPSAQGLPSPARIHDKTRTYRPTVLQGEMANSVSPYIRSTGKRPDAGKNQAAEVGRKPPRRTLRRCLWKRGVEAP